MKRISFYSLKRPLQERFIAATQGQTVPVPLAVSARSGTFPVRWVLASVLGFGAFFAAVGWGYGEVNSTLSLVSTPAIVAYVVLLAVALWCAIQAAAELRQKRNSPFELATYLFPGVLIDANTPQLASFPLTDASFSRAGRRLEVRLADRVHAFVSASELEAQALEERVQAAMQEAEEAAKIGSEWHRFDPLAEPRYSSPLVARERLTPYAPRWARWAPLLAVALAAVIAPTVAFARNVLSERKMYTDAVSANTSLAYQAYLDRVGPERRPDVVAVRLPSARLTELQAAGDVDALEQFAITHEQSQIKPAVDAILRQALLEELVDVARKESVSELRAFIAKHPKHDLVSGEIANVRKRFVKRLHEAFVAEHAAENEDVAEAFGALLAHAVANGPELTVRFQRVVLDKVARADKVVSNSKFFVPSMLPSQYFDAQRSRVREQQLFDTFERRFKSAFEPEVLSLELGEPIEPGQELKPQPERPLVLISHSTTMGGGIGNTRPNGIFVGVGLVFEARLFVPGRAEPLELRYSTWRMPDLLKLREGRIDVPQVYEQMAQSAFENFEQRLANWLIREAKAR